MAEPHNVNTQNGQKDLRPSKPQAPANPSIESNTNGSYSGHRAHYPNPRETVNPDPTTLRDQWRFAIRQYSKWYSHAWGTAILAGGALFALGWIIKGGNPLPSKDHDHNKSEGSASKTHVER